MMTGRTLHWFRNDLRLADNPALLAAVEGGPNLCLYILDTGPDRRPIGGASRWWLSRSLDALGEALARRHGRLVLMKGDPAELLPRVAAEAGINRVTWNRRYEAKEIALDSRLKEALSGNGIDVSSFNSHLLNEPWQVTTTTGQPMKVFTPYWRAARQKGEPAAPIAAPARIPAFSLPDSIEALTVSLDDLGLAPGSRTGPAVCGPPGHQENRAPRRVSTIFSAAGFQATPKTATGRTGPRRRVCHRICISAKSARGRSGMLCTTPAPPAKPQDRSAMPRNSCPRSAGASFPTTCSSTIPISRPEITIRASTPSPGSPTTRR